jgi:hypothetical protein
MTQENILVSPLIPACPKSGASALAFRPADPGDTAALFIAEEVCPSRAIVGASTPNQPLSSPQGRTTSRQPSGLRRSHVALPRRPCPHLGPNQKAEMRKSEIPALISPAWYRIISRRTAKRNFLQSAELNQK